MKADPPCPLCLDGTPHALEAFNDEHVIPAKLGGTFVVRAHTECNSASALAVDNPLMAIPDVEILRGLYGSGNVRSGARHRASQHAGGLPDGAPALLRSTKEGMLIEQVGRGEVVQGGGEGEYTVTMPPTKVEHHTDKVLTELRQLHPGKTIEFTQELRRDHITIEYSSYLNPYTWPRFAAKVALCALPEVMPKQWRGSDGEIFLQALFRKGLVIGAPKGLSAVPTELTDSDPMFGLLKPSEHLIVLAPTPDAVVMLLILFGELQYGLAVSTDLKPIGSCVWLCDPIEKRPVRFSNYEQLLLALFERQELFGPTSGLRHDRPHGNLLGPELHAVVQEHPLADSG